MESYNDYIVKCHKFHSPLIIDIQIPNFNLLESHKIYFDYKRSNFKNISKKISKFETPAILMMKVALIIT